MILRTGDIVEVSVPGGWLYGRVLMCPAAYPPVIGFCPRLQAAPAADPAGVADAAGQVAVLCPLDRAQARVVVPGAGGARPAPVRFAVPVRDRAGQVLYCWIWDGDTIELARDNAAAGLPVRQIVAPADLAAHLGCGARDRAARLP